MGFRNGGISAASLAGKLMKFILLLSLAVLLFGCRTNESPEGQVNDLEISAQVKSKLASDVGLSSVTNISINSTKRSRHVVRTGGHRRRQGQG
jgi:hypothetical protein